MPKLNQEGSIVSLLVILLLLLGVGTGVYLSQQKTNLKPKASGVTSYVTIIDDSGNPITKTKSQTVKLKITDPLAATTSKEEPKEVAKSFDFSASINGLKNDLKAFNPKSLSGSKMEIIKIAEAKPTVTEQEMGLLKKSLCPKDPGTVSIVRATNMRIGLNIGEAASQPGAWPQGRQIAWQYDNRQGYLNKDVNYYVVNKDNPNERYTITESSGNNWMPWIKYWTVKKPGTYSVSADVLEPRYEYTREGTKTYYITIPCGPIMQIKLIEGANCPVIETVNNPYTKQGGSTVVAGKSGKSFYISALYKDNTTLFSPTLKTEFGNPQDTYTTVTASPMPFFDYYKAHPEFDWRYGDVNYKVVRKNDSSLKEVKNLQHEDSSIQGFKLRWDPPDIKQDPYNGCFEYMFRMDINQPPRQGYAEQADSFLPEAHKVCEYPMRIVKNPDTGCVQSKTSIHVFNKGEELWNVQSYDLKTSPMIIEHALTGNNYQTNTVAVKFNMPDGTIKTEEVSIYLGDPKGLGVSNRCGFDEYNFDGNEKCSPTQKKNSEQRYKGINFLCGGEAEFRKLKYNKCQTEKYLVGMAAKECKKYRPCEQGGD